MCPDQAKGDDAPAAFPCLKSLMKSFGMKAAPPLCPRKELLKSGSPKHSPIPFRGHLGSGDWDAAMSGTLEESGTAATRLLPVSQALHLYHFQATSGLRWLIAHGRCSLGSCLTIPTWPAKLLAVEEGDRSSEDGFISPQDEEEKGSSKSTRGITRRRGAGSNLARCAAGPTQVLEKKYEGLLLLGT